MKTAKEFNKADTRSKFLKSAMRAKGPAYAEGGEISPAQRSQDFLDRFDEDRARESAKKEETARTRKPRSDRRNPDRATITKGIPMPPPPPPPPPAPPVSKYARGGRTQVSAETSGLRGGKGSSPVTPGSAVAQQYSPGTPVGGSSPRPAFVTPTPTPMPRPATQQPASTGVFQRKSSMAPYGPATTPNPGLALGGGKGRPMAKGGKVAKYAKGGSVRGAGCETRGLRKAIIY